MCRLDRGKDALGQAQGRPSLPLIPKTALVIGFQVEIGPSVGVRKCIGKARNEPHRHLDHGDLCGGERAGYKGFMRLRPSFAGWLLLSVAGILCAQNKPSANAAKQTVRTGESPSHATVRLLDENDGLAVLGAALETRHKTAQSSDCSHLVHAIYEKAGFSYKYEPSRDLYAGNAVDFQRVWHPKAGDLVVWPGHAGIVVNPAQHTFYSALRSGFGVQPYDSVYWRGRGRPRFYRYIKARPSQVLAARREVGFKPAGPSTANTDGGVPFSTDADDTTAPSVEPTPTVPVAPASVRFARPKAEQIRTSLAGYFRAGVEGSLQTQSHLNQPVAAFDSFDVQKVRVKDNIGWAQIHFRGFVWLAGQEKSGKPRDTQRFMIRRAGDGWEMVFPQDAVYVPRDAAVKMLAQQLAALADAGSAGKSDQKILLARWLNTLLEK
jgi:cell wall-associated NlpC family hydrolase